MVYRFNARRDQGDKVAHAVRQLQGQGFEKISITWFFRYAVDRAIEAYRTDPTNFGRRLKEYVGEKSRSV